MASKIDKLPCFIAQYYENDKEIDMACELYQIPLRIDGLFNPQTNYSVFSLGYQVNLKRNPLSETCLRGIGLGVEFFKNSDNIYCVKSKTYQSVYFYIGSSNNPLLLKPNRIEQLYDLKPLLEHKMVPKKVAKAYDEYSLKISFGKPLELNERGRLASPCWVEMKLNRIVDVPY